MTERRRDIRKTRQTVQRDPSTALGGLVKLFYRIGEVATIVGVAPHVLRYWESEFPSVKPNKSNHGQRVYTKRDVHQLLFIKHLLKEQGLTIAGARKQLRSNAVATFVRARPELAAGNTSEEARSKLGVEGAAVETLDGSSSANDEALAMTDEAPRVDGPATPPLGTNSKSLRQTLVNVRQELTDWLRDLH